MIANDRMERRLRVALAVLTYAAIYLGLMSAGVGAVAFWMPVGTLVLLAGLAWHWQRRADREWSGAVPDERTRELAVQPDWRTSVLATHVGVTDRGLELLPSLDPGAVFARVDETLDDVEVRHARSREIEDVLARWDAEIADMRAGWATC